ncbi:MAG: DUF1634 domain-containing protein [Phycisphaerae bacterium]
MTEDPRLSVPPRPADDQPARPPASDSMIQDASAWVLRIGVVSSVLVMLLGILVSFLHHTVSVRRMQTAAFNTNFAAMWRGVLALQGMSIVEVGVLLLVLTPIMRVATSMVLFLIEERDWFYTLVTLAVLALTLVSLLLLH